MSEDESPDLEDIHEVEAILGCKTKRNGVQYFKVKWRGDDVPTWEPRNNLIHCERILYNYRHQREPDTVVRRRTVHLAPVASATGLPIFPCQTAKLEPEDLKFWSQVCADEVFLEPSDQFLPDTSEFDSKWDLDPPDIHLEPDEDLRIVNVIRRGSLKFVRLVDAAGLSHDHDYDFVARLFPHSLKQFLEEAIIERL
jgi:hypothetical protein